MFQNSLERFEISQVGWAGGSVQLLRHQMGAVLEMCRRGLCVKEQKWFLGQGCVGWDHPQVVNSVPPPGACRASPSGRGLVKGWPSQVGSWFCGGNLIPSVQFLRCAVSVPGKESPGSTVHMLGCLGAPLTFSMAICLLGESCVLSSSWVPSTASPTSYDMHSHLIILKKNTPHVIPGHSGLVYFLLLVYYSLRYCNMQS